ncbi:MAG: glycosyltransferase [Chloroflexi bacterium]|nr:glycosyltransferase [Chloroflexota bacterium]
MRLLLALDSYWPNIDGVAVSLDRLAWALAARGHAVAVLAPRVVGAAERPGPVIVRRLPALRWPGSPAHLAVPLVRAHLASWRPDVIITALPFSLGLATLRAAGVARVPVVGVTSTMPAWLSARLPLRGAWRATLDCALWRLLAAFYGRCTAVVAVSATALALLRRHGLRRPAHVISTGVALDRFRPRPRDAALAVRLGLPAKRTVLYAGRLDADKRLDVLLAGFARLRERCDAHLLLVGDGGARAALERAAQGRGLGAHVTFAGFLPAPDYTQVFALADVFAITSPAELQSLVALEAAASGLPLVAVDAGALPELVKPGGNGDLVPPEDPAALAAALASILAEPGRAAALGRRSRALAAAHDLRQTFDRYEALLTALASDRGALPGAPVERSTLASSGLASRLAESAGRRRHMANLVAGVGCNAAPAAATLAVLADRPV